MMGEHVAQACKADQDPLTVKVQQAVVHAKGRVPAASLVRDESEVVVQASTPGHRVQARSASLAVTAPQGSGRLPCAALSRFRPSRSSSPGKSRGVYWLPTCGT